jgi:S-adenosylmethionine synthetase
MATAQLLLERGRRISDVAVRVRQIFECEFAGIGQFCFDLGSGKFPVC